MRAMSKPLSAPAFRPLYEQIKILLTQSLVAGEWKPGEAIPSEIELAGRFRVSQGTVRKAIDAAGVKCIEARMGMIPSSTVRLDESKASSMLKLMERMEDNDDVQNVYANFDIPDAIMEKLS